MESTPAEKATKDMIRAGFWEGMSYILLLFIAMPLKYMAGLPIAVRIMGTIHGILFILFLYTIYNALSVKGITRRQAVRAFLASLVPFGTFFPHQLIFGRK
jgi:integral membrane protein